MKSLPIVLFLFFTIPIVVFAQSSFCFKEEWRAIEANRQLHDLCVSYSGISSMNVLIGTGVNSGLYCASGYCSTCQFEYNRIAGIAADECCIMEKAPKASFSHYTCVDILQIGPGMSTSTITGNPLQYNIPDLCTDRPHPTCGAERSSSSSDDVVSSSSGSGSGSSSSDGSSSGSGGGGCEGDDCSAGSGGSSSSKEVSSSSSSSSGGGCSPYPLAYTPANPLTACFSVSGKCYKCNPDRGTECNYGWLWNSGFSAGNVGWWYREVTCDDGSVGSSSSSGSGGCAPYPLLSTPSDPLNACFTTNGKCYKCNPDRGTECSYSWLWNSGFSAGNVGWWYKEIACEGGSSECQDTELGDLPGTDEISFLFKKQNFDENSTDDIYRNRVPIIKSKAFYDILGRKTELNKTRRFLVEKSTTYPYNDFLFKDANGYEIYEKANDYKCGKKGTDYGIINKLTNQKEGGITCSYPVVDIYRENIHVEQKSIGECADGCLKISMEGYVIATHRLKHNKPFYVEKGYKYPDGSTVSKEQEDAIRKHEIGHQEDHARIVPTKQTRHNVSMIVCENEMIAKWKEWMDKLSKPIVDEYNGKIEESNFIYHGKYGNSGNPWYGYSP